MSGIGIYPEKMTLIEATEGGMILSKQTFCEYCNTDSDGYVKPLEKNCHAFISYGFNGWVLSFRGGGWHGGCKIRYCPMCGRDLLVK